jgi:hypothetical protein
MTFGNAVNETRQAIIDAITDHASNRPRALQTQVGASGIGVACERQLGYRLLGIGKKRFEASAPWMPQIGTAVHAYLEQIFAGNADRYLTEQPVEIRHGDITIPGTVDLYDKHSNTVIDFKIVGDSSLTNARRGKISTQYQVQVQLYGMGLAQAGHKVETVAIMYLPRNKDLTDAVLWQQPYDAQLAKVYIDRYHLIGRMVEMRGQEALRELKATDAPCVWCDWFNPNAKTPADGCPGILTKTNNNTN